MRHFVIGTAGHVDHGKTTLVRALTGVDTDRLPEEKKRGITIELGFAPLSLGPDVSASIVDVPGHKKLVHTMIAGAIGIELVLLVVAADEGVMPQTREHLAVCELLGIDRAVVALTKTDRAAPELVSLASDEIASLLEGRFTHRTVAVSARTGEGIDALRDALRDAAAELADAPVAPHAALAIDRAFSIKGAGAVVTGTLVRGLIKTADPIRVVSTGGVRDAVVRGLHVHGQAVSEARAPTRLALNLGQIERADLHRGDLATTDPGAAATRAFDASFMSFGRDKRGAEYEIYVGTARASGRITTIGEGPDGGRFVRVDLATLLPALGGDRYVVRSSSGKGPSGAVVGGGRILDARALRSRRREARVATLSALDANDAAAAIRSVAAELAPRQVERRRLASRYPIPASALVRAAEKIADTGELVRVKDEGWVPRRAVLDLATRAVALVGAHHASHPLDRGIKLETLRQKLGERAGASVADEAIRLAAKQSAAKRSDGASHIVVESDIARLPDFVDGSSPRSARGITAVSEGLATAALKGLGDFAIRELLGDDARDQKAILAKLSREGRVLSAGGQWFDARQVDDLRARVIAHYGTNAVMTIATFKALSGLGRKQAIPLLELFDREGVTRRDGDDRLPGPRAQPR